MLVSIFGIFSSIIVEYSVVNLLISNIFNTAVGNKGVIMRLLLILFLAGHQNGHINPAMSDESDIEAGGRKLRMDNLGSRNSLTSYREESEIARRRQSHL